MKKNKNKRKLLIVLSFMLSLLLPLQCNNNNNNNNNNSSMIRENNRIVLSFGIFSPCVRRDKCHRIKRIKIDG